MGMAPLKAGIEQGRPSALAERSRLVDHGRRHGVRGLFSVEGVKYTTARLVAEQAVDQVFASLGRPSPPCRTTEVRVASGGTHAPMTSAPMAARGEIVRAVRDEMAVKLTDIVLRRTALGALPGPDRTTVAEAAARVAGAELGWDALARRRRSTP